MVSEVPRGVAGKGGSMSFLWMLVVGLVVGAIAKLFMPGRDPGGIIVTMLLGIAGALVAGFLGRAVGWYSEGQPAGFISSILGAVLLLAIYRAGIGRTGNSSTGSRTDRAA